jgi:hypothetical protein
MLRRSQGKMNNPLVLPRGCLFKLITRKQYLDLKGVLNNLIRFVIHVFFPLVAGSLVYLTLRCSNVLFVGILENICCKYSCTEVILADWDWIKYNLPDGLWVYSLTSLMIIIWKSYTWKSLIWICSGLLIAIISEFCQFIGVFPGTYDPIDIVFYLLAFGLAVFNLSPITLKTTSENRL